MFTHSTRAGADLRAAGGAEDESDAEVLLRLGEVWLQEQIHMAQSAVESFRRSIHTTLIVYVCV